MPLIGGALPSGHYTSGMRALRLDWALEDCRFICVIADDFQRSFNPGRPNITMAAFLYAYLPELSNKQKIRIHRSLREIARAFDCSEESLRGRFVKIPRRNNAWKSK